jgi:hypothetical protein
MIEVLSRLVAKNFTFKGAKLDGRGSGRGEPRPPTYIIQCPCQLSYADGIVWMILLLNLCTCIPSFIKFNLDSCIYNQMSLPTELHL